MARFLLQPRKLKTDQNKWYTCIVDKAKPNVFNGEEYMEIMHA